MGSVQLVNISISGFYSVFNATLLFCNYICVRNVEEEEVSENLFYTLAKSNFFCQNDLAQSLPYGFMASLCTA